ncbi:MAG: VOC family protein [Shimia sp.]
MPLNPYLTFDGTAREAITVYAGVFGVPVPEMMTLGQEPGSTHPPELANRIMHARVDICGSSLMVSDTGPWAPHQGFAGITIQVPTDTPVEAQALFTALSDGGTITMPMDETFWARAFGMCTDKFGVSWMVNCD